MKKMKKIVTIMAFITLLFMVSSSEAEIPHLIRFQGKLVDADGEPLNDDRCRITFRIYDADDGGSLVWDETHQEVSVTNGVFTVLLGSIDPDRDPLDLSFDENYWLSMEVERDGEMAPRQQITSAGYAYHAKTAYQAENADRAESADEADVAHSVDPQGQDSGLDADTVDGYDTSTTASATSIPITGRDTYLPDDTVDRTALKTATGEVSVVFSGSRNVVQTLPGGTYGFFPQTKMSNNNRGDVSTCIIGPNAIGVTGWTTYATAIHMRGYSANVTVYHQQRYVTASGTDLWVYLLIDKTTKEIIATYQAPDHPSYGNGGDPEKLPHPFLDYDPNKHEIISLDKETCNSLKQESQETGKSILTLVNEECKPNMEREEEYQPLHSGKWEEGHAKKVMIEEIPDYIKVRKLVKLTAQEKEDREILREVREEERLQEEEQKQARLNALKRKLNLTDGEWKLIKE